jgi:hypothetical protein
VAVMLITGIQAAGKSSVAQAVAERLDRSVHLRGDVSDRTRPLYVVVLAPRPVGVTEREAARHHARGKTAYKPGDEGPAELDAHLRRETPKIGLWLDTSEQTLSQTVEDLLARVWTQAKV